MDSLELSEELTAQIERAGEVDVAVGLVTSGPGPALTSVPALRASLEAQVDGRPSTLIHLDRAPSGELASQIAEAWGGRPVISLPLARAFHGGDGGLEWSDAVRTVLRVGRAAKARAIVMLNPDIVGAAPEWPGALARAVVQDGCGLALGVYQRNRYDGTLTQSLVTPYVRALFGRQFRHPLADEFACSGEVADFALGEDVWDTDLGRHGLDLWLPVAAGAHGISIGQVPLGRRTTSAAAPPAPLGPTVGRVAAALFGLAERFEHLWLETRGSEPIRVFGEPPEPVVGRAVIDPMRMHVGFRQGVRDLLPIWERILAPDTLGDVLARSEDTASGVGLGDRLWARVVYDFLLAYRARVMYRSHLVQSLAPLYLGRTAALVQETRTRPPSAVVEAGERLGRIFEDEKPYLVDRWR